MLLQHLYDALETPLGIVVETSDPEALRQKLYALRKQNAPVFDDIAFIISPTEPKTQLWIMKKRHVAEPTINDSLPL